MSFITVVRQEIDRLEHLVESAKGAGAQISVLRGTLEMLQDIESGTVAPPEPKPPVPRHPEPEAPEGSLLVQGSAALEKVSQPEPIPVSLEPFAAVTLDLAIKPRSGADDSPIEDSGHPKTASGALADASTLPPITPRQAAAFDAVWKLFSAGAAITTMAVGGELKDRQGANDTLKAILLKGYIRRLPDTSPARYEPIAQGIPAKAPALNSPVRQKPNGASPHVVPHLGEPTAGRSAAERNRAINELNPVTFLVHKGHQCKKVTSDLYVLDGKTVQLKQLLDEIGKYRVRAGLPPLDLERYL